ncbi:FkbM family methyltransferase [Methylobacterium sp. ID0610]|uniref:FkbM family methyltransferase n=1 Tax=Methylobacterium carpenticola TaxID=3344827 RepID=UPI0036BC0B5F
MTTEIQSAHYLRHFPITQLEGTKMDHKVVSSFDSIYRALLKRSLNEMEKDEISKQYKSDDSQSFDLENALRSIIDSDEFFAANREWLFQKFIPEPCVVRAKGPLGDDLFVDLRQFHLGFAIAVGHFEPAEVAFVRSYIKPGFNILDIGANVGFFTNMFARLTGLSGSVHAFEPVGESYRKLVASIRANGWEQNVQTYQLALADRSGTMDIAYAERSLNMGGAHLASEGEPKTGERRERVQIARLDEVVPLGRYDFIKIDVEGAEWLVLQGAGSILQTYRPTIMIEFNPNQLKLVSNIDHEFLAKHLLSYGYRFHEIEESGILREMRQPVDDINTALQRAEIVNVVLMP